MAEDQVEVGLVLTAADQASDVLTKAGESVKTFGETAREAASATTDMGNAAVIDFGRVGPACDTATHAIVENGREIRVATREYKLANIEQMQYNQILQMTGTTCIQWGTTLQGQHNIVKAAIDGFVVSLDKATGGFSTYIGVGIQVVGMVVNMYAQYSRMIILWGMHAAAVKADALAQTDNTAATGLATAAQWLLNAACDTNPYVLLAAAIITVTAAVGGFLLGMNQAEQNTKAADAAMVELGDDIDQTKTKMRNLYQTGDTTDADKLIQKQKDLQTQMADLQSQNRALRELGRIDDASALASQMQANQDAQDVLQQQITDLPKHVDLVAVRAQGDKLYADVYQEYMNAAEASGKYMVPGSMDCPAYFDYAAADKDAEKWGHSYVEAWAKACQDAAYSDEVQALMDEAAAHLGQPLEAHSPPKVGPLKDVEEWGRSLAKSYAKGISEGTPTMLSSAGALSSAAASRLSDAGLSGSGLMPSGTGRGTRTGSVAGFTLIQHIYHADEDRIAAKVLEAISSHFI